MPPVTISTSSSSAGTTTRRRVGRPRTVPSSESISEPVEKLSPPSAEEASASTNWFFERADGSIIKMSHTMGIRISWSKGEVRLYVGNNKHYAAVFTGLQNAWSDGPTMEFLGERSAWEEEAKKRRDEETVLTTVERLAFSSPKFAKKEEMPF